MAASNRLQDLDPALLRPGRFDRQVLVSAARRRRARGDPRACTRAASRSPPTSTSASSRGRRRVSRAPISRTSATRPRSSPAARTRSTSGRSTSTLRWSASSPGCSSAASSPRRRSGSSPTTRPAMRVMSHLVGELFPAQKATIVSRGQALGYTLNTPTEDRYLHTREEFVDLMKVFLAGRAAEQVVFGRITNGAANDLERVTEIARSMVFEFGMSEVAPSRTMRADNYALSEETKRLRDSEQARLTDHAYDEALRLLVKHRVGARSRRDGAPREGDARSRTSSRRCSPTSCRSRTRPRPSAPCAPSPCAIEPAGSIARVRGDPSPRRRGDRSRRGDRDLRASLRRTARASRAARTSRVSKRRRCSSARAASSSSRRPATTRRSDASSRAAAPECTTSRSQTSDLHATLDELESSGAQLIDRTPRQGLFGLEVAFVHPDSVHGVLTEVVASG